MKRKPQDDHTFDLGAKKRVTVKQFNGVSIVDIREYYEDKETKELRPGKKGIALTQEVWNKLLLAKDDIDNALATLPTKRTDKDKGADHKEDPAHKEA